MEVQNGCHWEWNPQNSILQVAGPLTNSLLTFVIIDCGISEKAGLPERYKWSHDWLIDYLRDVIGPPYQSNLAKVDNVTWVGWQAITTLKDDLFEGTRCIISKESAIAMRISFPIKHDKGVVKDTMTIVESVSFGAAE